MVMLSASVELDRPDFEPNLEKPRHRWYPFKEGFSATLVTNFLMEHTQRKPGIIIDPFGGCGTTALEAATWGWSAITSEVNPFMAFLCKTKCHKDYDANVLWKHYKKAIFSKTASRWRLPTDSTLVERRGLEQWLFNRSVANRYEYLRSAIEIEVLSGPYKRLLTLALIYATTRAGNAKRDGKCWRYKSMWRMRRYSAADVDSYFDEAVAAYANDVRLLGSLPGEVRVHTADSRHWLTLHAPKLANKVDVVLTSPPYLNSFDYTDIYRPECFLLGCARTSNDLRKLRFKTMRSHVQVDWPSAPNVTLSRVTRLVKRLTSAKTWNNRIPQMVNAYFYDLEMILQQCRTALKTGGTIGVVVANSAYAGIVVPVDEILVELAERAGFRALRLSVLRRTNGNGHHQNRSNAKLRESLVVAQAY